MSLESVSRTILIVEDEPLLRKILIETFGAAGFTVMPAADGEIGLKLAIDKKPDVILLDILLPKIDGINVLKKIRLDSWGKNALIIMLTNLTADNEILQGLSDNLPSYYFIKSNMDPDQLVTKIKEILAEQPAT